MTRVSVHHALERRRAYPRSPGDCASCGVVACDGTWVPIRLVAAAGAWKESLTEWLEIQEARWRPLPPKRQQWRRASDRPEGSRCERRCRATGRGGKPKHCSGAQNRRTRVPQGNPGTRAGSQGARRGSQEGSPKPSGPGGTGPGLPMRHPRTRRTPGLTAGDGRRVHDCVYGQWFDSHATTMPAHFRDCTRSPMSETFRSIRLAGAHRLQRPAFSNAGNAPRTDPRTRKRHCLREHRHPAGPAAEAGSRLAASQNDRRASRRLLLRAEHAVPRRTAIRRASM